MIASTLPIKRALLSVSDKTGLVAFAKQLSQDFGVELLSTGGTAKILREAGLAVTQVSSYTGAPEIMDGRVKTLHPKIHGGILARRGVDEATLKKQNILPIDLVVVNLYPFEKTIMAAGTTLAEAIENIDIGGPCMLRAAAKNYAHVTLASNINDYERILADMQAQKGATSLGLRRELAKQGFAQTMAYDKAISQYLAADDEPDELPNQLNLSFNQYKSLRYGENPHQKAAVYTQGDIRGTLVGATQHQGKALSYNNLSDADAALACVNAFDANTPTCVIVKHANPCGVATGTDLKQAYERAFACDPVSAFGGILAFNQTLDAACAQQILDQQFAEVIIAPEVAPAALEIFSQKKNLRVLATGQLATPAQQLLFKPISGGVLAQQSDDLLVNEESFETATHAQPSAQQQKDLMFAWTVAKFVKSNAIVYAKNGQTLGIGAGQMSRVDSARIAAQKAQDAGLDIQGAAMASDAFFPFRDGVDTAGQAGIACVIQPGGSIRDSEVIQAANDAGMAMIVTGMRHFRH